MLILQETRKNIENTTSYFYENLTRTQNKKGTNHNVGGGIAIGISKNLNYRRLENIFSSMEHDLEILCVQIVSD